jgi:hypothetical protein
MAVTNRFHIAELLLKMTFVAGPKEDPVTPSL